MRMRTVTFVTSQGPHLNPSTLFNNYLWHVCNGFILTNKSSPHPMQDAHDVCSANLPWLDQFTVQYTAKIALSVEFID